MKISELIEKWEPGDWPMLKGILIELAGDREVNLEPGKSKGKG